MNILNLVPVIVTSKFEESKGFYITFFGFDILYEEEGFVDLVSGGEEEFVISFIDKKVQAIPEPEFNGKGLHYMLEVDDLDAEYERLQQTGLTIDTEIRMDTVGERHFTVTDPNGIRINIYTVSDDDIETGGNGNGNYL